MDVVKELMDVVVYGTVILGVVIVWLRNRKKALNKAFLEAEALNMLLSTRLDNTDPRFSSRLDSVSELYRDGILITRVIFNSSFKDSYSLLIFPNLEEGLELIMTHTAIDYNGKITTIVEEFTMDNEFAKKAYNNLIDILRFERMLG